jgi:hypothetical protein
MATKIEVSEFARRINIGVKSQMGIRRLSNRALARGIKRSEKYVRERVNDEQEWRIADLERMCELWRMTFGQLTSYVDFKADHSHPEATGADSFSSYQFVAVMDGDDIVQILDGSSSPLLVSDEERRPIRKHSPSTEIESGNAGEGATRPDSLTDEERKRIVLEKLRRGDVSLAANKDPHKLAEMEGGDGRW